MRGLSAARLVVVDEAAQVPDDLLAALRPMTAVSGGSIVIGGCRADGSLGRAKQDLSAWQAAGLGVDDVARKVRPWRDFVPIDERQRRGFIQPGAKRRARLTRPKRLICPLSCRHFQYAATRRGWHSFVIAAKLTKGMT